MIPYSKAAQTFACDYAGDDYDGVLIQHNLDTMHVVVTAYNRLQESIPNIYIRIVDRNSVRVTAQGARTVVVVG